MYQAEVATSWSGGAPAISGRGLALSADVSSASELDSDASNPTVTRRTARTTPRPNASQDRMGSSSASGVGARPRGASVIRRRPRSATTTSPYVALSRPVRAAGSSGMVRLRGGIGQIDQHELGMVVHRAVRRSESRAEHSPLSAKIKSPLIVVRIFKYSLFWSKELNILELGRSRSTEVETLKTSTPC